MTVPSGHEQRCSSGAESHYCRPWILSSPAHRALSYECMQSAYRQSASLALAAVVLAGELCSQSTALPHPWQVGSGGAPGPTTYAPAPLWMLPRMPVFRRVRPLMQTSRSRVRCARAPLHRMVMPPAAPQLPPRARLQWCRLAPAAMPCTRAPGSAAGRRAHHGSLSSLRRSSSGRSIRSIFPGQSDSLQHRHPGRSWRCWQARPAALAT